MLTVPVLGPHEGAGVLPRGLLQTRSLTLNDGRRKDWNHVLWKPAQGQSMTGRQHRLSTAADTAATITWLRAGGAHRCMCGGPHLLMLPATRTSMRAAPV